MANAHPLRNGIIVVSISLAACQPHRKQSITDRANSLNDLCFDYAYYTQNSRVLHTFYAIIACDIKTGINYERILMKKTALSFCVSVLFSCKAGPLCEYDKRIAQERRTAALPPVPQMPMSTHPIAHPHTPHFEYPLPEPLPGHIQESIQRDTDFIDDITHSLSNLLEWFTS